MTRCIRRWFFLLTGQAVRRGHYDWVSLVTRICGSWREGVFPRLDSPPSQVEHPKNKALALAQAGGKAPFLQIGPCPFGVVTFILSEQVYLFFF